MKPRVRISKRGKFINRYGILLVVLWSLVIAGSLTWNLHQERCERRETARREALAAFEKDVIYREWNANHGGVYAAVTESTPPNPHLAHMAERDIETPSGRLLTLINPAYMTRQAHELGLAKHGARGHITSLNPIRPENTPDPWEKQALESFERGATEMVSLATLEDGEYLRFMRPLVTSEGCLKCHAEQGYKKGDIRGGISVSIPMAPYNALLSEHSWSLAGGHLSVWLVGLIIIGLGTKRLHRTEDKLQQSINTLSAREERLRAITEASPSFILVVGSDGTIEYLNRAYSEQPVENVIGRNIRELIKAEDQARFFEALDRVLYTGKHEELEVIVRTDGGLLVHFVSHLCPLSVPGEPKKRW